MSDVLFEYKSTPSFGRLGMPGGRSIVVFSDGAIVYRYYVFGQEEPSAESRIAVMPEAAVLIEKVLNVYKNDLKRIPSKLWNGTLDGSIDCFQFGEKKISSCRIRRTDLKETKRENPDYYKHYKKNMIQENMVLDIYNEIISILNGFELGLKLEKK